MTTNCDIIGRAISFDDKGILQVQEEPFPGEEWLQQTFPVDAHFLSVPQKLIGKLLKFKCVLNNFPGNQKITLTLWKIEDVEEKEIKENE